MIDRRLPRRPRPSAARTSSILTASVVFAAAVCVARNADADPACAVGEYQVVGSVTTQPAPPLVRTDSTVQVGCDPLDRFHMVRLAKQAPAAATKGVLLLLPTVSNRFPGYEATATGNPKKSFAAFFALRGYEVWGVTQRTEDLAAGDCESGAVDCSAMAGWGMQALVDDARFVTARIAEVHPEKKPVVAGVSLGSMAGTALLNAYPVDYAGGVLMDGALYDVDPATRAVAAQFCGMFEGALSVGVTYDGQSLPGMRMLAGLAAGDPSGLSPLPGMPAGFTNHQAFVAAMSAPGVGPLTPRPDYFMMAGDPAEDRLFFASDALALANMATFADYLSIRMVRDVDCALAGERAFTDNLAAFEGPVLMMAGGHGFGPGMLDTAELMTGATVTMLYEPGYGHMDHFFNEARREVLEQPILEWLDGVAGCD